MKQKKNKPGKYEKEVLHHSRTSMDRDYFSIPVDDLRACKFDVTENPVDLTQDKYVNLPLLEEHGFDTDSKETVVFNLPTNSGKSTVFYDLVQEYSQRDKYMVLVCSPFVKLVEKDHKELIKRNVDAVNYKNLQRQPGETFPELLRRMRLYLRPVHVMTINCLLRNPSHDELEQNMEKSNYLDDMIRRAEREKLNVVIFIDELHESVHNFSRKYLPNIARWRNCISKIYIASATYTASSYPIIQLLAKLTNNRIRIFESNRDRSSTNPAKLTIHLVSNPYSADNLSSLQPVKDILAAAPDHYVKNVLIGYKSLVETLKKDPAFGLAEFNETTGNNNNEFLPDRNNIGTTFKTGINIDNPDNVFIIILPYLSNKEGIIKSTEYGIFADGVSALIQALGRQRCGGECHVIMGMPKQALEGTLLKRKKGELKFPLGMLKYLDQNELFSGLVEDYGIKREMLSEEISIYSGFAKPEENGVYSNYPTLQEHLLENGTSTIACKRLSGGKGLGAYLLWAACNDQFHDVQLTKVIWYHELEKELVLSTDWKANADQLYELFPDLQQVLTGISIHEKFDQLYRYLFTEKHDFNLTIKTDKRPYSSNEAKKNQQVVRWLFSTLLYDQYDIDAPPFKKASGSQRAFDAFYFTVMLQDIQQVSDHLHPVYKGLESWLVKFYGFIESQIIPAKPGSKTKLVSTDVYKLWGEADRAEWIALLMNLIHDDPSFQWNLLTKKTYKLDANKDGDKGFGLARQLFTTLNSTKRQKGSSGNKKGYHITGEFRAIPIN